MLGKLRLRLTSAVEGVSLNQQRDNKDFSMYKTTRLLMFMLINIINIINVHGKAVREVAQKL